MDSLEKTMLLGKIEGKKRKGQQRIRWLDGYHRLNGHEFQELQEMVEDREAWHAAAHGVT